MLGHPILLPFSGFLPRWQAPLVDAGKVAPETSASATPRLGRLSGRVPPLPDAELVQVTITPDEGKHPTRTIELATDQVLTRLLETENQEEGRETKSGPSSGGDDPTASVVTVHRGSPHQPASKLVSTVPQPSAKYDSDGNLRLFDQFNRAHFADLTARVAEFEERHKLTEMGAEFQLQAATRDLQAYLRERELVRLGRGTFQTSPPVTGTIDRLELGDVRLTYHVTPDDEYVSRPIRSNLFRQPAPTPSPQQEGDSPPSARTGPAGDELQDDMETVDLRPDLPPDAAHRVLCAKYEALHLHTEEDLQQAQLRAARIAQEAPRLRALASARAALHAFRQERECVRNGSGSFRRAGRWVEARVRDVALQRGVKQDKVVLTLHPVNGRPEWTWEGGECRMARRCCSCSVL